VLPPTTVQEATKLRRSTVPLRHSGSLRAGATKPRLEVFLHPFGWVVQATVDLVPPEPLPLPDVPGVLATAEAAEAEVGIGTVAVPTTVGSVMDAASTAVEQILGDPAGAAVEGAAHRLVSVIDATSAAPPAAMPAAASLLHLLVHRLSAGGAALPAPQDAFIPRWTAGSFVWAPAELVYIVDRGTSVLTRTSLESGPWNEQESSSGRHRRLGLLIAHVSASAAVVRAGRDAGPGFLSDWARQAADRLGRLYGPAPAASDYWGLEARHLINGIGADQDVVLLGHAELAAVHEPPKAYPQPG
jgi:hypothetical protein